jgi:hypothetical protein
MLKRQRHDTGTHAAANEPGIIPRLSAGILLAAALTGSATGAEQAGDVAAQANNPLANMPALNFQDYYIDRITDTDKDGNQFWVRFAKPFAVGDTSWLMRASLPVNTYPVATGGSQATGIGDLNVFATYLFDTGNPAVSFGLGPPDYGTHGAGRAARLREVVCRLRQRALRRALEALPVWVSPHLAGELCRQRQ